MLHTMLGARSGGGLRRAGAPISTRLRRAGGPISTGLRRAGALVAVAAVVSACTTSAGAPVTGSNKPVSGGTAYFAEQPSTPPTYIFPLTPPSQFTVTNTADFQTLLYLPLYFFGDHGSTGLDLGRSLAAAPVYSHQDTVVTVTLKPRVWSDGEPVSARDVVFWMNLLRAERENWASYVPGGFPDNVTSVSTFGTRVVVFHLNRSYNPTWFTFNELSQITPLPIAWDKTSLARPAPSPSAPSLPDTAAAGARAVYRFLDAQAKDLSGYAQSPIWAVVDGPWRLVSFSSLGEATFVPNRRYEGADKAHLARFVELPFTSAAAEFNVIRAGPVTGGQPSDGQQVSVGFVPDNDLPERGALAQGGLQLVPGYPFQFDYFEPNFNNPVAGPIFRQLYFRVAFQHLVDQSGWIRAFYDGLGVPTYGPIPAVPANPYADANASRNPYPFDVKVAAAILSSHGWAVRPGAVTTCISPGTGVHNCGHGVNTGQALVFQMLYPSGLPYTDNSMLDLQSAARQVGIEIDLKQVPPSTIAATVLPCSAGQAACSWQLGQYGSGWVFEPDHYPSGEEIFQTGALGNVGSFSDPSVDRLIVATTVAPPSRATAAMAAYQDAVRLLLPDFWQPSPGTLYTVQANLHGFSPNAYGFITPQDWYFTAR